MSHEISNDNNTHTSHTTGHSPTRRVSTETKHSLKTTELPIYILAVVGVLIAAAMADEASDFGTEEAWKFITWLTIGYLLSRGLAKSGSRDFYDDDRNNH